MLCPPVEYPLYPAQVDDIEVSGRVRPFQPVNPILPQPVDKVYPVFDQVAGQVGVAGFALAMDVVGVKPQAGHGPN